MILMKSDETTTLRLKVYNFDFDQQEGCEKIKTFRIDSPAKGVEHENRMEKTRSSRQRPGKGVI